MNPYSGAAAPSPELGFYQLRQAVLQAMRSVGLRPSGAMRRAAMELAAEQLRIGQGDLVFCDTECPDFLTYLLSGLAGETSVALASPLDGSLNPDQLARLQQSIGQKALAIVGANRFAAPETARARLREGGFKQLRHGFGGRMRQGLPTGALAMPASAAQFLADPLWKAACGQAPIDAAGLSERDALNDAPQPDIALGGASGNGTATEKKRGRGRPRKYPLPTAAIWWTSIPAADRTTMAFWESNRQVCGAIALSEQDRSALFFLSPEETTAVEMGQLLDAEAKGGPAVESRRVGFGEIFASGGRYCPEWYLDPANTCGEAPLGDVAQRIGRGTTLSGKSLALEGPLPQCSRLSQRATEAPGETRPSWMPRTGTLIEWGNLLEPNDICYLEASGIQPNGAVRLQLLKELPPQQGRYVITPQDGPVVLVPRDGGTCVLMEAPCTILLANSIFAIRFAPSDETDEAREGACGLAGPAGRDRSDGQSPKAAQKGPRSRKQPSQECLFPLLPAFVEIFLRSEFGQNLIAQLPKPLGKNELASISIPLLSLERQREVIEKDRSIDRSVAHEAARAERLLAIMDDTAAASRFDF